MPKDSATTMRVTGHPVKSKSSTGNRSEVIGHECACPQSRNTTTGDPYDSDIADETT